MSLTITSNNVSTQTNETTAQVASTRLAPKHPKQKQRYVFVLQLHNGKYVIGSATNAAKRVAAINSGMNPAITKTLQVNRIIGIRPCNETRSLPSVVAKYCERFGENNVIAV